MSEQSAATVDIETVNIYLGDVAWHDGPGWYWVHDEYPEDGSCGAFTTEAECREHAQACGYQTALRVLIKTPFDAATT